MSYGKKVQKKFLIKIKITNLLKTIKANSDLFNQPAKPLRIPDTLPAPVPNIPRSNADRVVERVDEFTILIVNEVIAAAMRPIMPVSSLTKGFRVISIP